MKGLDALNKIKKEHKEQCDITGTHFSIFHRNRYDLIEKELKALEIIKNKNQRIGNCIVINIAELNEIEYSLLKEVLKYEQH